MDHHAVLPVDASAVKDLVLHHYPSSPFAHKVRMILGFKKLAWRSVLIPSVMPKPDMVALTGGYRKTPILQIGADIYCDTALICDVLEHLQPDPTLYPPRNKGAARLIAQWADNTLFWTSMAYNFTQEGSAQMFASQPPNAGKDFADDRAKMRLAVPRVRPADAAAAYKSYLRRIANMLESQAYLLGAEPCLADFAAYHPLWFTRHQTSVMAAILDATPVVLEWMDRMATIAGASGGTGGKDGNSTRLSSEEAIALAARSTPALVGDAVFQDEHGIALGTQVTISSDSFGPEPTGGELVAATRMHYTVRRVDDRAGTVHVHIPRIGYVLKAVRPA